MARLSFYNIECKSMNNGSVKQFDVPFESG